VEGRCAKYYAAKYGRPSLTPGIYFRSLLLGYQEMQVHSENISLGGILLSSAFPIPEGTTVDLAIGSPHLTLLSARGKVVRVQPKLSGTFAVALVFECLSLG
jgi:hypothetical protein